MLTECVGECTVFFRRNYQTVLEEFMEVNPYMTADSRSSYERFLRLAGFHPEFPGAFGYDDVEPRD